MNEWYLCLEDKGKRMLVQYVDTSGTEKSCELHPWELENFKLRWLLELTNISSFGEIDMKHDFYLLLEVSYPTTELPL